MLLQNTTMLHVAVSLPWCRQSDVHSQQRFFCQMQTAEVTVDQAEELPQGVGASRLLLGFLGV